MASIDYRDDEVVRFKTGVGGSTSLLERHWGGGDGGGCDNDGGGGAGKIVSSAAAGCPDCSTKHAWRFLFTLCRLSPILRVSFQRVSFSSILLWYYVLP